MSRVVSFLPAGTEIAYAIGVGRMLVGRSHECDFPPEVTALPIVSKPALELEGLTQAEIDSAVANRLHDGASLYEVDELLLRTLDPDVILTQDLCQVCAPSGNELTRAIAELPRRPAIVWLTPRTIEEIHQNVLDVGSATGATEAAETLIHGSRARLQAVARRARQREPRRVVFLEWIEPYFAAGHWVPEMITLAGGVDPLANPAADSQRVSWEQVVRARPETIVVAPCGYALARATELAAQVPAISGTSVFAVDANAFFARPGPRVAEGVELLGSILHPDLFGDPDPSKATRIR